MPHSGPHPGGGKTEEHGDGGEEGEEAAEPGGIVPWDPARGRERLGKSLTLPWRPEVFGLAMGRGDYCCGCPGLAERNSLCILKSRWYDEVAGNGWTVRLHCDLRLMPDISPLCVICWSGCGERDAAFGWRGSARFGGSRVLLDVLSCGMSRKRQLDGCS